MGKSRRVEEGSLFGNAYLNQHYAKDAESFGSGVSETEKIKAKSINILRHLDKEKKQKFGLVTSINIDRQDEYLAVTFANGYLIMF